MAQANLIKRSFKTTDTRGCEFEVTLYKTRVGYNDDYSIKYESEYVAMGLSASTLNEIKRLVGEVG